MPSLGHSRGPPQIVDVFLRTLENAMPFVSVPNTAEATVVYSGPNNNQMVNTYHFRRPVEGWDPDSLQALGEALLDWEENYARGHRSNQVRCLGVECRDLNTQDSFLVFVAKVPPIVGQINQGVLPANVTLAVSFRTPFAGRSFRGRSYWIGLAEGDVSGDFVSPGRGDGIVNACNALKDVVAPAVGAELVVVSKVANGQPRTVGVATPVTSIGLTDFRVDTQRRRLIGEGG